MPITQSPSAPEAATARAVRWLPGVLAVAVAALLGGLLLGRGMASAASGEGAIADPVSVGFLRDMPTHHAQAVEMSEIVHRRSDDPALTYLAFDIMSTQQGQIGIMTGWLDLARQTPSTVGDTMAWMDHEGPMPGMATAEEIEALRTLPVPQMEEQYLRLMIDHHRGALPMAQYAAREAESTDVADLAEQMDLGQAAEIDLMQDLLVERGWFPEPEAGAGGADGHADHSAPAPSGPLEPSPTSAEPSHGDH